MANEKPGDWARAEGLLGDEPRMPSFDEIEATAEHYEAQLAEALNTYASSWHLMITPNVVNATVTGYGYARASVGKWETWMAKGRGACLDRVRDVTEDFELHKAMALFRLPTHILAALCADWDGES